MELYFGETKPDLNDLAHYGVKGMKWGVRKNVTATVTAGIGKVRSGPKKPQLFVATASKFKRTPETQNKKYNESERMFDRAAFGRGGEKRINRRMNKGQTLKQARRREVGRNVAIIGAAAAASLAATHGDSIASAISQRAETNRGRAAAANLRGLGADSTIRARQSRKGVYKVTDM